MLLVHYFTRIQRSRIFTLAIDISYCLIRSVWYAYNFSARFIEAKKLFYVCLNGPIHLNVQHDLTEQKITIYIHKLFSARYFKLQQNLIDQKWLLISIRCFLYAYSDPNPQPTTEPNWTEIAIDIHKLFSVCLF